MPKIARSTKNAIIMGLIVILVAFIPVLSKLVEQPAAINQETIGDNNNQIAKSDNHRLIVADQITIFEKSNNYRPPSKEIRTSTISLLSKLERKYNKEEFYLVIKFLSGNQKRERIANNLAELFNIAGFNKARFGGSYQHPSSKELPSIVISSNPNNKKFAKDLCNALTAYFKAKFVISPDAAIEKNKVQITICGEPNFLINGSVFMTTQ